MVKIGSISTFGTLLPRLRDGCFFVSNIDYTRPRFVIIDKLADNSIRINP